MIINSNFYGRNTKMNKIFLYLYPIYEFQKSFTHNDEYYKSNNLPNPFLVLNQSIHERYRSKGYQVVYVLYPNKNIYGIIPQQKDRIIYTDITFEQATNTSHVYPNEEKLLMQVGDIDKLIVGGYHSQDCVKRLAEYAQSKEIDTLVELDLTDLFFKLYQEVDYFNISEYIPERDKEYVYKKARSCGRERLIKVFQRNFSSSVYRFNFENKIDIER